MGQLTHLNEGSLANKHLVDVEQDVAAFDDHSLDRQVLADVFRFGHLQSNGNINKLVKYFLSGKQNLILIRLDLHTIPMNYLLTFIETVVFPFLFNQRFLLYFVNLSFQSQF